MDHFSTDGLDALDLPDGLPLPVALSLAEQAKRNPDEILRIVLRGACGFESVEEICQREGISREQFQRWRELFAHACQDWTEDNRHLIALAASREAAGDDGVAGLDRGFLHAGTGRSDA